MPIHQNFNIKNVSFLIFFLFFLFVCAQKINCRVFLCGVYKLLNLQIFNIFKQINANSIYHDGEKENVQENNE